ncbi:zinc finger BED domain-containing protein RICESLEEPER 2 [Artemisia annua]|uniref:Zinc finger BED domain-containing protein RICESLEEPER 2 n=1 Tax=Artemisia annua TaxID=35608 RepID=A0A2U1PI66_ARTAN|nr:zinc finger BED domain-containing protein RICESLEEPER 2 [Artemisia annua]
MDQSHLKNTRGESISSSVPTYESFASQQDNAMEDQTIDVETLDFDDNKRERKAPAKTRKTTCECWKYFDPKYEPDEDGVVIKMAYCKWCDAVFKADSVKHAFIKKIGEKDEGGSSIGTLETWKYDEKVIKKSLIKLIVLAELPFKFVEHPTFIEYSTNMQPRFSMPSRFTIARDISKFNLDERKSLVNFLSNKAITDHLTTDTWTSSCKRMNFMVLTAHFIDDDWVMHKRIINFRPIHSHRGVDIGRAHLECITGWGIKNVMTMTVDNIVSNEKALEYLIENLPTKYDGDLEEIPKRADFEVCKKVVAFLEKFKETTELVSNVSSPVAHLWFGEVLDIDKHLHPKTKSKITSYGFRHLIENGCIPMEVDEESDETPIQFLTNEELCAKLVKKVETDMGLLFAMYKEKYGTNTSNILCIQVSTVASESAFSASGRILDPYRNSLAPNIVEALVCTQEWIRTSSRNITVDTLEDLIKDDELAKVSFFQVVSLELIHRPP